MLLTKHKVQELVEGIEIDMDEIEANAVALVEEFDDDSVTLVYVAIETFKDKILDELGRVS
uniref:Uncharacterized protein n=1 Tax=Podoviridae sp. ct9A73 TaxID=2825225 RepID=A0A8S5UK04_9CAUD|nr:MAG TPA: Protein of unknown function (DUF1319) [Podoviridae sp. ct9A73]